MSIAGWIYIFLSAVCAVVANLLLRIGLENKGVFGGSISDYLLLFRQPAFIFGLFFYAIATLSWVRVLSSEPLNIAYPLLVSITFAMVILSASILFNESFGLVKFSGIVFILIGITLMAQS